MRLSPLDLQWVMNAELLPLAALTLVAGALGDRFGQKRIFLTGIALYGLGATAIAFAPSFAPLIVGRFLQGLSEALILPNGFPCSGKHFPPTRKPVRSASGPPPPLSPAASRPRSPARSFRQSGSAGWAWG